MNYRSSVLSGIVFMTTLLPIYAEGKNMIMWYMPLRVETFAAVTMEDMETSGAIKYIIKKQEYVRELMTIITRAKKTKINKVRDGRIRVKLCYENITYYIDAEGNFMNSNREFGQINTSKFSKIIEKFAK
ncbi:MAG: hypothetical protein Q8O00_00445 [Holophaga sp.]|nr:hypothetical protein [Holophaga sp.]